MAFDGFPRGGSHIQEVSLQRRLRFSAPTSTQTHVFPRREASKHASADSQSSAVEVPTSNSSIQAGFAAYAQTVEHHGLLLTRLEKRIEDLEAANDEKDMIIEELIENKLELITTIEDLQQKVKELGENDGITMGKTITEDITSPDPIEEVAKVPVVLRTAREQMTDEDRRQLDKNLIDAAKRGSTSDVKFFLSKGANVDARNWYGSTALLLASYYEHTKVVQILIEAGADLDIKNFSYETAVYWAACTSNISALEVLITAGADLNIRAGGDRTALDEAENDGLLIVVNMLRAAGAVNADPV